jgi:hypothetical protein
MAKTTPVTRELSRQILAQEGNSDAEAGEALKVAQRVLDRMRAHLSNYVGDAGYRAILSRAYGFAKAEDRWLRETCRMANGTLEFAAADSSKEAVIGVQVVLAHVLALLDALVGEALTLGLMQDVWPALTLDPSGHETAADGDINP